MGLESRSRHAALFGQRAAVPGKIGLVTTEKRDITTVEDVVQRAGRLRERAGVLGDYL
jgi:hypothetical protein